MNSTLFVKFDARKHDEKSIESLAEAMHDAVPQNTDIMFLPQDIDLLSQEEVNKIADELSQEQGSQNE